MRQIILMIHNVRSTHNVGSILRTAEGFGVEKVYLTGYTPYPKVWNDERLPHLANKNHTQISKTALGAESLVQSEHVESVFVVMEDLRNKGFNICALEQSPNSIDISKFKAPQKIVLIVGREVEGIEEAVLSSVDSILQIPMFGKKESFNVAVATGIALFQLRFA